MKETVDFNRIEPSHAEIHERLLNWARCVAVKAPRWVHPMFKNTKTSRQWDIDPHISKSSDFLDGHVMEKAVSGLPIPHREAIRWWYVHRNSITSQRRAQGLTLDGLHLMVRDGRQMLKNTVSHLK